MMRKLSISLLLLTVVLQLQAQENSPYSRYGIGLLKSQDNIAYRGMGGTSVADNSALIINTANPASFASLRMTTYQLGLEGASFNVRNNTVANRTGGAGLSYVNIGIPIAKKKAGISFGLLPFSRIKYAMQQETEIPNVGAVVYDYFGGGGIQKAYLGGAYKYKGFSLGATFGYLFGNYQNSISESFPDSLQILSSDILSRTIANGVTWQVGAMYEHSFKESNFINVGATYGLNTNLNASREKLWFSALGDVSQGLYSSQADSLTISGGEIKLPSTLSLGVMYGSGDTWKVGLDFLQSDWTNFTAFGEADSFKATYTLRMGASYTPDVNEVLNYWKKLTYRVGGYLIQEPIYLNNTQFNTTALTVGLSYPIRRTNLSIGQINAAFDVGARGTLENGLIRESFTRFAIGLTVNDRWFLKRKYD